MLKTPVLVPITEVKQHWAALVLGWVTAWEYAVLYASFFPLFELTTVAYKYHISKFWREVLKNYFGEMP